MIQYQPQIYLPFAFALGVLPFNPGQDAAQVVSLKSLLKKPEEDSFDCAQVQVLLGLFLPGLGNLGYEFG